MLYGWGRGGGHQALIFLLFLVCVFVCVYSIYMPDSVIYIHSFISNYLCHEECFKSQFILQAFLCFDCL